MAAMADDLDKRIEDIKKEYPTLDTYFKKFVIEVLKLYFNK